MSTILVTGVAGFIGSEIAKKLLLLSHEVYGIDDLSNGYKKNIPQGVNFIEADLSKSSSLKKIPKGIDVIFHLSGQSSGEVSFEDPIQDLKKKKVEETINRIMIKSHGNDLTNFFCLVLLHKKINWFTASRSVI